MVGLLVMAMRTLYGTSVGPGVIMSLSSLGIEYSKTFALAPSSLEIKVLLNVHQLIYLSRRSKGEYLCLTRWAS